MIYLWCRMRLVNLMDHWVMHEILDRILKVIRDPEWINARILRTLAITNHPFVPLGPHGCYFKSRLSPILCFAYQIKGSFVTFYLNSFFDRNNGQYFLMKLQVMLLLSGFLSFGGGACSAMFILKDWPLFLSNKTLRPVLAIRP